MSSPLAHRLASSTSVAFIRSGAGVNGGFTGGTSSVSGGISFTFFRRAGGVSTAPLAAAAAAAATSSARRPYVFSGETSVAPPVTDSRTPTF